MSLIQRIIKGSAIQLLIRLIQRSLGIISMIILARLLTPEDFGMVAIATLFVFLFQVISETGSKPWVIQKEKLTHDEVNSAWTFNLWIKTAIWVLFLMCIPWISAYYDNPNLNPVLFTVSWMLPLSALSNPGLWLDQKAIHYLPLLRLSIAVRLFTFVIVLIVAWLTRSYWALIIGLLATELLQSAGSYWVNPYRPKIRSKNMSPVWQFARWNLPKSIVGYLRSETDIVIISSYYTPAILGGYNMMKNLSTLPTREIITPVTEPLYASFAEVKQHPQKLDEQFRLSVMIITLTALPLAALLTTLADPIVALLLGEQWLPYSPILSILAWMIVAISYSILMNHLLIATGAIRALFWFDLSSLIVLFSLLLALSKQPIENLTWFRTAIGLATTLLFYLWFCHRMKLQSIRLFITTSIASLPTLVAMSVLYHFMLPEQINSTEIIQLIANGTVFSIAFVTTGYLLLSKMQRHPEAQQLIRIATNLLPSERLKNHENLR